MGIGVRTAQLPAPAVFTFAHTVFSIIITSFALDSKPTIIGFTMTCFALFLLVLVVYAPPPPLHPAEKNYPTGIPDSFS